MTTTTTPLDRAAINRRNAQKSTGPRTPEGKNRSRFNAVKHGMTAKTLVLPDEDADVLQIRVETWIADLQPQNDVEQFLVEQAVHLSWKLERAERAEVARLSHIIRSGPIAEANREHEVAAALGDWLLSDKHITGNYYLRRDLLGRLLPKGQSYTDSRTLDILDHPAAIVFRLESTAAGCQWLLDRWTELRAPLEQGDVWSREKKLKAIRLLGNRPLDLEPSLWEDYLQKRKERPDPNIEARIEVQLNRQLDKRLPANEPTTLAVLRSIAEGAIARLEALAVGHRERAEADAAQQVDMLSFDASTEAERLRRYQFSCTRSLFRSIDTLIKVRRNGLGLASGEQTNGSEDRLPLPVASDSITRTQDGNFLAQGDDPAPVVSREIPRDVQPIGTFTMESAETITEISNKGMCAFDPVEEAGGIVEMPTDTDPTPATTDEPHSQNEPMVPPVDHQSRQVEPMAPQVAAISGSKLPFHRTVILAMTLVVLFSAAVRSHRDSQNEPTAVTVDHQNRQNKATVTPHPLALVDADAIGTPPAMTPLCKVEDPPGTHGFKGERGSSTFDHETEAARTKPRIPKGITTTRNWSQSKRHRPYEFRFVPRTDD